MDLTIPGLPEVITFGGASIVVAILFEAIKAAWKPSDESLSRFGPLMALGIGVVLITPFGWYQGADLVASALVGFMAGASASGLYGTTKSVIGLRRSEPAGPYLPTLGR